MPESKSNRIYSATYSNVPVYEYNVAGNHVMRRRSDDWINATHILKVADFDKPARTRILEREVQKGTHEKVQGGYGKYQGTWIPLDIGRELASKNGVLDKLLAIFDFVPGDRSPPPAPKHATAASSKPKAPRPSAAARKSQPASQNIPTSDISYDGYYQQDDEGELLERASIVTESDEEMYDNSQRSVPSRKRKRGADKPPALSHEEQQHLIWSDELLDYFMLQNSNDPLPAPPDPPMSVDLNRAVDDKGHTPMHWAAAMGDLNIVQDLQSRGAHTDVQANNWESPLMRAVIFTNNFDRQTMSKMIRILESTIEAKDRFGSNVFHHIAATTCSKSKYPVARYYLDTILNRLSEIYNSQYITQLLDQKDNNGDTPVLLAARYGARKCVRSMMERGAAVDIPNKRGETADRIIEQLNARRRDRYRQNSSSPVQPPNGTTTNPPSSLGLLQSIAPYTPKTQHFQSEAASLLASQLPTLITSRAEALAMALESELADREAEVKEATRLLEQRRLEVESLQKQTAALAGHAEDDAYDDAQQRELDELLRENERLVEAEQAAELSKLAQEQQARQPNDLSAAPSPSERLQLARSVAGQQTARANLVRDVVAAQSLAGVGERCELYKRLITGALGVRAEDVESMLPDMLSELREAHGEGVDADGDLAMGNVMGSAGDAVPVMG